MFRLSIFILTLSLLFGNQDKPKSIVFFGDSITAGYGINIENAFPALIQGKLDSMEMNYTVINAGLSGETTAGGLQRIDWILKGKPEVFILELGGNDGLRGLSLAETRNNLTGMIEKIRVANEKTIIILAGMQLPPNLGQDYAEEFRLLYSEIANEEKVALIPFLLKDVGGERELNLADGIHPNETGHRIVAETVWNNIRPLLN
jgi:acyl-CoA thioesterase I